MYIQIIESKVFMVSKDLSKYRFDKYKTNAVDTPDLKHITSC